jgi:tetratricopeptide (TPR) repeat protein
MLKKILIISFILAFAMPGLLLMSADQTNDQQAPPKALKLIKKAQKAIKDQDFEKALKLYNEAVEVAPEYAPSHMGIAQILRAQQKFQEAVPHLEKALGLKPDYGQARELLAKIYLNLGQQESRKQSFKTAAEYYEKTLTVPGIDQLAQLKTETHYILGITYVNLRNFQKAIDNLLKFMEYPEARTQLKNEYTISNWLLGINFAQTNKLEESNKYLRDYLELAKDPAFTANTQQLAAANFMLGSNNFEIIEAKIKKILDDETIKDVAAKKEKIMKLAEGQKDDIQPYLEKAIELNPTLEDAHKYLGNYFIRLHEKEKALKAFEQIMTNFPNSSYMSEYKQLIEDIKKSMEIDKKNK